MIIRSYWVEDHKELLRSRIASTSHYRGELVGSFFPVLILLNISLCVEYNQEYQQRKFKSIICVCGTALIRS